MFEFNIDRALNIQIQEVLPTYSLSYLLAQPKVI